MKSILIFPFLILSTATLIAQKKPIEKMVDFSDTVKIISNLSSPVKFLSKTEYEAYLNAEPMGLTALAEMNNYPSPSKVLSLQSQLKITPAQKSKLNFVQEALDFKAKEMGRFIIQNEKKLYDLFLSGKIDDGSLIYYTNQYGLYQGELRNAHLQAHLKTRRILTPDQIKKIGKLRHITQKP
ncbi:MAG: Spy/CpxP family protein refolding chaperone [Flavobacterium sp.]|nr:Spy/CpxP family protein refolding chaperone [Pedobacter sp.]